MKNFWPLFRFIAIAICAGFLAHIAQPFVHGNEKAVDLIVNVFSILAGFLVAILTLFSDMQFDQEANWRQLQLEEDRHEQRYTKHSLLFYTYLVVLVCVFVVVLLKNNPKYANGELIKWVEYAYLWFASLSIFYSFMLPNKLIKMRKDEWNKLMNKKRPNNLQ